MAIEDTVEDAASAMVSYIETEMAPSFPLATIGQPPRYKAPEEVSKADSLLPDQELELIQRQQEANRLALPRCLERCWSPYSASGSLLS